MRAMRNSCIIVACLFCLFAFSTQAQETDAQKILWGSIDYDKLDVAVVKSILDKGGNPNWVSDPTPKYGWSVLGRLTWEMCEREKDKKAEEKGVEILQMLFTVGAKLQPCDQGILYYPVAQGWALFTEVLLKNGANPTGQIMRWKRDKERTPMEIAVSYAQANIVELLRKYGVPALDSRTAAQLRFIEAAGVNDIPAMKEAVRNGAYVNGWNRQGETALIKAVSSSRFFGRLTYETIQCLFEKGADPTIQGEGGYGKTTALHRAIENSTLIFSGRLKDSPFYARSVIESLLRHGALVSARDSFGMTPLHWAADYNNIVGAKMLIEAGAKIMPRDDKGKTPLDYAESAEMIKLLKDHGAKEE